MNVYTLTRYNDCFEALCNPHLAQSMYDAGGVVMDDVLLTLHGEAHKARRHLALRVFRRDFARYYEREVFPKVCTDALTTLVRAGDADIVRFGQQVTMNLTADFAGIDRPRRDAGETAALLALVRKFGEGATLVHSTRDHAQVRAEVRTALAEFEREFLAASIARRRALLDAVAAGTADDTTLPRDILTVLLRNEDRVPLPHAVLTREIAFYLQAGSHSTANALVHTLHELFCWCACEPAQRARLQTDALYLQRAVHESLRLHPASPVAWRRALKPCALPDGTPVAAGDRVVLDLAAANCDTTVFGTDAHQFNPERVITQPRAYPFGLTFGTGVHLCLGRDLDGGIAQPLAAISHARAAGTDANERAVGDVATHDGVDADRRQLGIITCLLQGLLAAGVSPHPTSPPRHDESTQRSNWATYPVTFEPTT